MAASHLCPKRGRSTILDREYNLVPSADRLSDSLIEWIESSLGFNNAAQAVILSYNDAAVMAIVYAIAWLDLRTITGQG